MTGSNRKRHTNKASKQQASKREEEKNKGKTNESKLASPKENLTASSTNDLSIWTPGSYLALKALISARVCSSVWGILNDCDEVYNYWEPTHYMLYGQGFQTWEYSPAYALRSYTYLLLHAGPAYPYSRLLQSNRILVFFFIRCMLAVVAALSELYFYRGVCKKFGANIGRVMLGLSLCNAGLFSSTTAYLPSSFAMYMTMVSYGAYFEGSLQLAIFATALSTFIGWPFAALIGLPIAIDIVLFKKKFTLFVNWSLISSFTILAPMVQYDSKFFGRLVIAPLNLVSYNVFSSNGPDLYGKEPFTFYIMNGLLNFNLLFPLAICSFPVYLLLSKTSIFPAKSNLAPILASFGALFLWLSVFFWQPHKEERFLFPIYPMIVLFAAYGIDMIQKLFFSLFGNKNSRHYLDNTNWVSILLITLTSIFSLSRIVGQYQAYSAPFDTFLELQRMHQAKEVTGVRSINICYGREWHRFPSSFFLPSEDWTVKFIESEFRGQLPSTYSSAENATAIIPKNMNDENKEEKSRYVPISSCHFIIDIDKEEETEREPRYSLKNTQWSVIHRVPFLDAQRSPRILRAFYIPFLTKKYCSYVDYVILQSNKLNRNVPDAVRG